MKYILLPIHPEWCCKLMNGDKETEVRRGTALYNAISKLIKEQGKAPCLIYCTKGDDILIAYEDHDYDSMNYYDAEYILIPKSLFAKKPSKDDEDYSLYESERDAYRYYKNDFDKTQHDHEWKLNGKVIAQFEAESDRIFNVRFGADEDECDREHAYETSMMWCEELERSSCLEYDQLLEYLGREWDDGYIGTAIHVKRGTMKAFDKPKDLSDYGIKKAPQSWCYAEVRE